MNAAKIRTNLTLALALLASPTFAQTTIDDFATGQSQLQAAASCSGTSCSFVAGGMLGAERDIRAHLFSGSGTATAEVTGGAFVFSGVGTAFAEARLVWDGTDGDADATAFTGLGGTNLTTGADSIILDVNSSSAGTVVIVEVFTSATGSSLYTLWLPAVAAPTSFALPFTAFTTHLGSGAVFTNVGAVSLTVRGPGATLSLNAFRAGTGPAPGVAASKTVAIENDLGRAGTAEPGDTIKYTIQIDNKSGKPSSSNTALVDNLDANLTLVPGSAEASPIGIEDHYFQGGTTISIAAPGVLGNDVDPDGDAKSVAVTGSITTSKGATATVNADGSFSVPISADGTLDTFTYEVTDGNGITSAAVVTVGFVNQAPVVTTTGGTTAFTEDAGSVVVDNGLTVTDDGTTLASATVTITNLLDGANEVLTALPSGSILAGDISYAAGTLTITRAGGLVSEYQTVLRSVRYENTSNAPSTTTRSLAFAVNDGFAASNTGAKSVSVTAANDAPVLTAGATLAYTENDPASVIDGTITVNDADSATLTQATVTLTTFQAGQDVLSFTNDGSTMGNVAVGTNVGGVLTLNSAGGTATLAQWQSALRAVRYANSSENPTTTARTVTWRVNDGAGSNNLSNQPTSTINITAVNDAPVVTAGGTLNYTENQAATAIDTTITVADPDSANLTGATVQITANYANGDDVLSYVNALGITGVFTPATGTLTLSGTTTVANYQTALRNVRYNNTSENPTTGARTISWQVNDGAGVNNLSSTVTSTVNVTAVNDAPVALAKASAVQANMRRNTIDVSLLSGVTDVDNGVNGCVSTTFSVANIGATVTNGTVFNVNLGAGTFDFEPAAGFTGTATVSYTVSDTGCPGPAATSAPATISITVSGPVIWFVNPALGSNGDGRLSSPFNILSSANTAKGTTANHRIFVFTGTTTNGTGVSLAGDGTQATAQWLIGQGATGASFDSLMGITPPSGTIARPSIGGTRPTIQGTLTLNGNNVKAQGFNLSTGASPGVNDAAAAISGVSVSEVSVTSTTGTAVSLSSLGGVLSFTSVSTNGAANGISLTSTTGSFTVTGNSAGICGGSVAGFPAVVTAPATGDCTGGTILASTGPGVLLNNAASVSLTRMRIANGGDDGIRGIGVAGFALASSLVESNGPVASPTVYSNLDFGEDQASGFTGDFVGLTGTASITNSTIRFASNNNILVRTRDSSTPRALSLTISGTVISGNPANAFMNDGVLIEASQNATITSTVTGSYFSASKGDHYQAAASNNGVLNVTLNGNTMVGGHSTALGQGITINAATGVAFGGYTGRVDYDVIGNSINGAISNGASIVLGTSGVAAVFDGFVRNNIIGTSGSSLSCSTQANGVYIDARGNGTHTSAVTGNTIRQCFDRGILSEAGDGDSVLNLTVTGNTIDQQVDPNAREAIQTNFGITSANVFSNIDTPTVCLQLGGAGGSANVFSHGAGAPDDFRLRKRFEATVRLPGYAGGTGQDAGSLAQVVAFVQGQNTGSAGEPGSASASGTGGGYTGGAVCPVPLP